MSLWTTYCNLARTCLPPDTAIHAVSGGKHVLARLQYVVQSDIDLVLDNVNPEDLQKKKNFLGGNSCKET